jgi:hypothetical protein
LEVCSKLGATIRFGRRQLGNLGQRSRPRFEVAPGGDLLAQLISSAQEGLGGCRIVPKARIAGARVQLGEL